VVAWRSSTADAVSQQQPLLRQRQQFATAVSELAEKNTTIYLLRTSPTSVLNSPSIDSFFCFLSFLIELDFPDRAFMSKSDGQQKGENKLLKRSRKLDPATVNYCPVLSLRSQE
jgi:hypothetical protein